MALHHAGFDECPRLNGADGTYSANEGILLRAIRDHLDDSASQGS